MEHDKTYKILAVDDEDKWQNVCKEAFPPPDYELLQTKNMMDAVKLMKESDGVIVNLHFLPDLYREPEDTSGKLLLNYIKDNHPFMPRIVFTADSDQNVARLFEDLKLDNIVFKGIEFDPSVLQNRMRESISKRTKRLFISYATEDYETAKKLWEDIKKAGAYPWLDRENLDPGENWQKKITQVIKQESDYCLVLLSRRAVDKKGFFQKEQKIALEVVDTLPENKIFIIPVRLDDCETPQRLKHLQWVDLFPYYEEGFKEILKALIRGKK